MPDEASDQGARLTVQPHRDVAPARPDPQVTILDQTLRLFELIATVEAVPASTDDQSRCTDRVFAQLQVETVLGLKGGQ